jgi:LysR family transcriptional regulator, glycine cleavage system transcriptional activator
MHAVRRAEEPLSTAEGNYEVASAMIGDIQDGLLRDRPVPKTKGLKKVAIPSHSTAGVDRMSRRPPTPKAPRTGYRRAPLASLRVFVAVAEHKSFTRGADALGVTASAASMQVQALEKYLRVPLFRRNGRQVELTPEGQLLLPKVEQALADLERAIDEARADRGSGPLRVTTLAFFLAQWLLPRLPNFTAQHAGIDVQIHTSTKPVDFVKTGVDAGIRFGAGSWPRLHCEKLLDEWLVPVCTPALLERHGPVAEARDLRRYKLLHSPYEPWTAWLLDASPDDAWPSSGAAFDDAIAIVRASVAGQGLALARWSLVGDEVTMGRLAVAGRAVTAARSWYFVCPQAHLALEKVAAFREWLATECARFPAPPLDRPSDAATRPLR